MIDKEVILTYEGLKKLEDELENLKSVKRREIAERIKAALAFGDLSENAEYDEAKNDQAYVEARIAHIENMLKHAKVIDEDEITTDTVGLGTKVMVLDIDENEQVEYTIVGSTEADPSNFKISNESPVGRALIGLAVGNEVKVVVPDGLINIRIIEIHK